MLVQRHTVKSILDFNEARDDQVLGWQLMPLPSNNLITGICGINWTWCKQSAPHFIIQLHRSDALSDEQSIV